MEIGRSGVTKVVTRFEPACVVMVDRTYSSGGIDSLRVVEQSLICTFAVGVEKTVKLQERGPLWDLRSFKLYHKDSFHSQVPNSAADIYQQGPDNICSHTTTLTTPIYFKTNRNNQQDATM